HTRCYRDWSSDVCSSDLMAAGASYRWFGTGSQCATYGDAGARPAACRGARLSAFPFGLLSILPVFPPAGSLCHDAARPARSAGAPAGFHDVLFPASDFDIGRTAQAGAASELGTDHLSWPAAAILDATSR